MYFTDADLAAIIAAHPNKATGTITTGVAPDVITVSIDGIFTAPAKNVVMFDSSVNSLEPRFTIPRSEAAAHTVDIGTVITINSQAYSVIDTEERNDGMVGLPLSKA